MRRATVVVLASLLVGAGVLRSHLLPLTLLVLLGALIGLLIAWRTEQPHDLRWIPLLTVVVVLTLVGVGQLGVVGILLGLALLVAATPMATTRSRVGVPRHRTRRTPRR